MTEDKKSYTVAEAAELLDISREAVRKRIARGTLEANKNLDKTWSVYLTEDDLPQEPQPAVADKGQDSLVKVLRERIEGLERQIEQMQDIINQQTEAARRQDTILLNLTNKLPQLQAPKPTLWDRITKGTTKGNNQSD